MDSPLKVRIYSNPWDMTTNIALMVQRNGQWMIAKPVTFDFVPVNQGEATTPTMMLSSEVASEFLKAMAQALDDRGIKTDTDAKLQGSLEATKYHLEDMRGMLAWFTNPEHQHGD